MLLHHNKNFICNHFTFDKRNQANNNKELKSRFGGNILNSITIDILGNFLLCPTFCSVLVSSFVILELTESNLQRLTDLRVDTTG